MASNPPGIPPILPSEAKELCILVTQLVNPEQVMMLQHLFNLLISVELMEVVEMLVERECIGRTQQKARIIPRSRAGSVVLIRSHNGLTAGNCRHLSYAFTTFFDAASKQ